jgi:diacylglycerol kinase family enzyme
LTTRRHRGLRVALDGEVRRFHPPVRCRSLPAALTVLAPAP